MITQFKVKAPNYVPGILNAMDKLFSEDFHASFLNSKHPAVNIVEKEKGYDIVLMTPGLSKNDFNLSVEGDLLTISYEKKEDTTETTDKFVKQEFSIQSFKRSFTLNDKLNKDEITASYEGGLLTVSIPKLEVQESKSKTIAIS